jgi:hypothetical protein
MARPKLDSDKVGLIVWGDARHEVQECDEQSAWAADSQSSQSDDHHW